MAHLRLTWKITSRDNGRCTCEKHFK